MTNTPRSQGSNPVPSLFDDFSVKAKKSVTAAQELAERLGDKSVATGHLVYGICLDESTCVHHVFKDLNVDPEMFAGYVGSLPREAEVFDGAPFNRHVHTVFERARETAHEFGSKLVTPEHIAIALMSVKAGSCYETLKEFSVEPGYVQALILEAMGLDADAAPEWF